MENGNSVLSAFLWQIIKRTKDQTMTEIIETRESCQDEQDSSLSMERALQVILQQVSAVGGWRSVTLREALGGVLAEDVISPLDVPSHRNSAMDGYALAATDLPDQGIAELQVIGTAFAGHPFAEPIRPGTCVRIMTGAKMPDGADTVVMQEQAEQTGDRVRIDSRHRAGQNVRQAGEDIGQGSVVLAAGVSISAAQLGLLASVGIAEVRICRRVRVAFFSSGDEIRSIGEPLAEGQIYDSNRYTLYGMLTELGAEVMDLGVIPDREESIGEALELAAQEADLILTSGGVSVGEADYIVAALRRLGTIHFSKVAIKPGRPLTFGHIGNTPFFGLPGNPVAVMVTFLNFVAPALRRMMGQPEQPLPGFRVPCLTALRKSPGRTEIQRGIMLQNEEGQWAVRTTGRQGSGVLSSMSAGDCFILLPEAAGNVAVGDPVQVLPFRLIT